MARSHPPGSVARPRALGQPSSQVGTARGSSVTAPPAAAPRGARLPAGDEPTLSALPAGAAPPATGAAPPTAVGAGRPAGPPPAASRGWGVPLAVLIIGMFMSILDTSIVNVAIPTIQKEFGSTTEDIQWITTAYTLCLGIVVPTTAWLGDRIGLKQIYLLSLVSFSVASALCGLAWDLTSMVFFRILQAIPGGIIPVTCLTTLYRIVPRERIGTAMGLYGLGVVVAPAVGPTLGGYLVEYVDWRLIFFINVPVGVLGTILAFLVLPNFAKGPRQRFDLPGFLTIAPGLFALLLAVSKGEDWGWTGYRVLMLITYALLSLALFVVIELEVDQPLLDVRIFKYWPFLNSLLLITIVSVGLFAGVFYVPVFLQNGQNMQAFDTGLLMLPSALVMLVMMPLAGRLFDLIGPRIPAVVGLLVNGLGTLMLSGINADVTREEVIVWMSVRSLGLGLSMMPIMTGGISALPPSKVSSGSAFNNVIQRTSAAFGLAALTALATSQQTQITADRSGLLRLGTGSQQLHEMAKQGALGLYPLWRRLELETLAQAYSDVFLVVSGLTLVSAGLALFLRHGAAPRGGPGEAAEIG
jgi:EmrB/QacA subfamily drug resistance transporter